MLILGIVVGGTDRKYGGDLQCRGHIGSGRGRFVYHYVGDYDGMDAVL